MGALRAATMKKNPRLVVFGDCPALLGAVVAASRLAAGAAEVIGVERGEELLELVHRHQWSYDGMPVVVDVRARLGADAPVKRCRLVEELRGSGSKGAFVALSARSELAVLSRLPPFRTEPGAGEAHLAVCVDQALVEIVAALSRDILVGADWWMERSRGHRAWEALRSARDPEEGVWNAGATGKALISICKEAVGLITGRRTRSAHECQKEFLSELERLSGFSSALTRSGLISRLEQILDAYRIPGSRPDGRGRE